MEFSTQYCFQRSALCATFVAWVFLFGAQAFAALGGDVSSVQADQVHMNASLHSTQRNSHVVHELRTPTGMVVHEFASQSGRIFAVSWKGPSPPDLRQLLGLHFEDFQASAVQRAHRARGPLFIEENGLVVQFGGHMRSYTGRAYLTDQIPPGVRVDDLR